MLFAATLLLAAQPLAADPDLCPMRIEVTRTGAYYTNRFRGHFRTSPKLLEDDLVGGCLRNDRPVPTSSVRVELSPQASPGSVKRLFDLLAAHGWPKEQVDVTPRLR